MIQSLTFLHADRDDATPERERTTLTEPARAHNSAPMRLAHGIWGLQSRRHERQQQGGDQYRRRLRRALSAAYIRR